MPLRWVAAAALVSLFTGCKSAPPRWSPRSPVPAIPQPWDRAMCRLGEYPAEIDARALAWARYHELRARQSGSPTPSEAGRIVSEREAFDARCALWRTATAGADPHGATEQAQ